MSHRISRQSYADIYGPRPAIVFAARYVACPASGKSTLPSMAMNANSAAEKLREGWAGGRVSKGCAGLRSSPTL